MITEAIRKIISGEDLSFDVTRAAMEEIMDSTTTPNSDCFLSHRIVHEGGNH